MKTIAAVTPKGNLIFKNEGITFIYLAEKEITIEFIRYGSITTYDEAINFLPTKEINTEKILDDMQIIEKQTSKIELLTQEVKELRKIKAFYGECPKWHIEGFKNQESYEKLLLKEKTKEFYATAKKNFKLKTNKAVDAELCWVFTTHYAGKNNGFRHFSRDIEKTLYRIEKISDFSRNKNLCVKEINGEVLELRGNIEASECL